MHLKADLDETVFDQPARNLPIIACALAICALLASLPAAASPAPASAVAPLSAESRLKSCDPAIALAAAEEIVHDPASLKEPLSLFAPATVMFLNGKKDEAVFWYFAAQLRTRYQLAFEKEDRGQLLYVIAKTEGKLISSYALQDIAKFNKTIDQVLEWDKKTANPFRDQPKTADSDENIKQLYAGFSDLKSNLAADKDKYETRARRMAPGLEQQYMEQSSALCGKGQIDPAYAEQEKKNEWAKVLDFVKNNNDVAREAGKIKDATPVSSTRSSNEVMPSRYEVSVSGENGKPVFAIIDVIRLSGKTSFFLTCTTHTPLGSRNLSKDACLQ
jgi:hypothetical protein